MSDSAILSISRVSLHLVFLLLLPCFLSSRLFSFVIRLLLCFYLYLPVSLHPSPSLATISPSYSFTHITSSLLFSTSPSFLPFSPHLSLSISQLISLATLPHFCRFISLHFLPNLPSFPLTPLPPLHLHLCSLHHPHSSLSPSLPLICPATTYFNHSACRP